MNPTLETIFNRKSVRAYCDQPLTQEEKESILRAAFRAPTAGNMMLYSIIEIEDQALKDRLVHTCDNQPFIAQAPYILLFLADYQRWMDVFIASGVEKRCQELERSLRNPGAGDLILACCDALIAAQTAVVAAESMGIGSCYIGDVLENYEIHREMFNLPDYAIPIVLLCFGRPTPEEASRAQPGRFDRQFIVHKNAYRRLENAELKELMRPREELFSILPKPASGAQNAGQAMYFRKFIAEFSLEMNRSVNAMLKAWAG